MDNEVLRAILDSFADPVVFVDTNHIIRYLNKTAVDNYKLRGQADLTGKSIFDCHNANSKQIILEIVNSLTEGVNEKFLKVNKDNYKVFVRAVRDPEGKLLGYYERFEKNI